MNLRVLGQAGRSLFVPIIVVAELFGLALLIAIIAEKFQ